MSLQARRNSLFKSSISIKSIGDSVQKFSKSLRGARKNADESIKTIRQSNIFKKGLIRNDDLYFRKRQENIKRKDREDELEASSVQGAPKTQGNILTKSTRGFLGRMLDFVGVLLIGWAIQNLPRIISGINGLIKRISSVTGILSLFVEGIQFVLGGIGTLLQNALSSLLRFDFLTQQKAIEDGLGNANTSLTQARQELNTAASDFQQPESYGLPNPPGFDLDNKQEDQSKDDAKGDLSMGGGIEKETPEMIKAREEIGAKIDEAQAKEEDEGGDDVVQGDAEDVEGKESDVGKFLQEAEPSTGGGGAPASTSSGGEESISDPRDLIEKQKKAVTSEKTSRRNERGRSRSSSFLETPDSINNINQSVTSPTTTLATVDKYDPDFKKGSREVDLSSIMSPSKKEVNIETKRKSKSKIMIIEKPGTTMPSGSMPSRGSGGSNIASAVNDEKILMKMQSTSTLKFT
jgi:hypothetical protein